MLNATITDISTVSDAGYHDAFTDLIFFEDTYYCAFRRSRLHGPHDPGCIVVMVSTDAITWALQSIVSTEGDDRDPVFFCAPGNKGQRLGLLWGTYLPRTIRYGKGILNSEMYMMSHVAFKSEKNVWTLPVEVYRPQYWLWSVADVGNILFAASYHHGDIDDTNTIHMHYSFNGYEWKTSSPSFPFFYQEAISEPSIAYNPTLDMVGCVVRRDKDRAIFAQSFCDGSIPIERMNWQKHTELQEYTELAIELHSPELIPYGKGWLLGGRRVKWERRKAGRNGRVSSGVTALYYLEDGKIHHLLDMESMGDNGYPGIIFHPVHCDRKILMTYYTQHASSLRSEASVYCAHIELEEADV